MFSRSPDTELGALRALLLAVFVLAVPVALITTTIRATISEQAVYDYSVREFDAENAAGIPEDELIGANGEIRNYLVNDSSGPLAVRVTGERGEETALFSAREVAHMNDVRNLVQLMFDVQVVAVILVLTLAVVMIALWPIRVLAAGLLYGAFFTGVIFGAVGFLALTGFDAAWTQFHGLAFANDLWQLDQDRDHLIQMFTEVFWFQITALISAAVLLQAILMAALAAAYLVLVKPTPGTDTSNWERPCLPGRAGHSRLTPPNARPTLRS